MIDLKNQIFYKYRSLENLDRFLDIIVNNRLYGAVYNTLNDPMEGKFNKQGLEKSDFEEIYGTLKTTRICSLLKKQDNQEFPNNFLMWPHYADSIIKLFPKLILKLNCIIFAKSRIIMASIRN